jgi:DNA-binding NarL/FixJ family response regulator
VVVEAGSGKSEGRIVIKTDAACQPIRVLIVDDHPLLREGIGAVIEGEHDMQLVAEASNGEEAVAAFRQHQPDITLMDMQMPKMDGVSAITAIRAEWPQARVMVLTTYRGDVQALRALKAGACGYLLKSLIRTELLEAIRAVHAGHRRIPKEIALELAEHLADDALSSRELQVLKLVATGNANRQVAVQLGISEETVKAHMKNILSKLTANDRTHAVTIALKRGIIDV